MQRRLARQLKVPVLVTHGAADEVVRIDTGRHIARTASHTAISEYERVGHAPFWEAPEPFNAELAEFACSV